MKSPIVGYIVVADTDPLFWKVESPGMAEFMPDRLCWGETHTTMFHTRRQARLAIQKTLRAISGEEWHDEVKRARIFAVRCGEPSRWKKAKS